MPRKAGLALRRIDELRINDDFVLAVRGTPRARGNAEKPRAPSPIRQNTSYLRRHPIELAPDSRLYHHG